MKINKITLVSGKSGDILIQQGPGFPAFFIPGPRVTETFSGLPSAPRPGVITSQVAIALLIGIAGKCTDLQHLAELPEGLDRLAPAFRVISRTGYHFAYVGDDRALGCTDWLRAQGIHLVFTPTRARLTPPVDRPHPPQMIDSAAELEQAYRKLSGIFLTNIAESWATACTAFQDGYTGTHKPNDSRK